MDIKKAKEKYAKIDSKIEKNVAYGPIGKTLYFINIFSKLEWPRIRGINEPKED